MATTENKAEIKQSAQAIHDALSDVWPSVVILSDDGKDINKPASKRAVLGALSLYMKNAGYMQKPGRKAGSTSESKQDFSNLHAAAYMAFASHAKGDKPALSLPALLNATAATLAVPFDEFDKAKREIRRALDTHPHLQLVTGTRKFDGTTVVLRGEPVNPSPFRKWGEPAPAPAAAAPVADASNGASKVRRGRPAAAGASA